MISVEFKSVGPGCCAWCRKDRDEVYTVAFSDKSFVGPMCKADLLRAVGMKVEAVPAVPKPAPIPAVAAVPVVNGPPK